MLYPLQMWCCCCATVGKGILFLFSWVGLQHPQWVCLVPIWRWYRIKEMQEARDCSALPMEVGWDLAYHWLPAPPPKPNLPSCLLPALNLPPPNLSNGWASAQPSAQPPGACFGAHPCFSLTMSTVVQKCFMPEGHLGIAPWIIKFISRYHDTRDILSNTDDYCVICDQRSWTPPTDHVS